MISHETPDRVVDRGQVEELLISALSLLSPIDIIESKRLEISFLDFLGRGTVEHCWRLVPTAYKARLPLATAETSSHIPSSRISSSCPAPSDSPVAVYFKRIIGNNQVRVRRLTRIVRGFEQATALPLESYEKLWSAKEDVFAGIETGPGGRLLRLQRGRKKMKQASTEYECASRLSLLFLSNDVDHILSTDVDELEMELSSGRGRRTVAFGKLAKSSCIPLDILKQDCGRARNYIQLLAEAGPGSLLELGPDVNAIWEKNLTKEDIKLAIEYRKEKLPKLKQRADSLNALAARIVVDGLLAYGWTYPEVLSIRSKLMNHVKPYLDECKLARDMTIGAGGQVGSSKKRCSENIYRGCAQRKRKINGASKACIPTQNTSDLIDKTKEASINHSALTVDGAGLPGNHQHERQAAGQDKEIEDTDSLINEETATQLSEAEKATSIVEDTSAGGPLPLGTPFCNPYSTLHTLTSTPSQGGSSDEWSICQNMEEKTDEHGDSELTSIRIISGNPPKDAVVVSSHDESPIYRDLGGSDADALRGNTNQTPLTACFQLQSNDIDLASYLLYQPDGIDLASYLLYQLGDIDPANYPQYQPNDVDLANYPQYQPNDVDLTHQLYFNNQDPASSISERPNDIIAREQLLGNPTQR